MVAAQPLAKSGAASKDQRWGRRKGLPQERRPERRELGTALPTTGPLEDRSPLQENQSCSWGWAVGAGEDSGQAKANRSPLSQKGKLSGAFLIHNHLPPISLGACLTTDTTGEISGRRKEGEVVGFVRKSEFVILCC